MTPPTPTKPRPRANVLGTLGGGVDHYENFPVASWLCPPRLRPTVVAIYRFARTADDIADEGSASAAERLADLAAFRDELARCIARASGESAVPTPERWPAVFGPLGLAIARYALPGDLLHDLLSAFEQDVRYTEQQHRYQNTPELLGYCRLSANPVGRLVLHLFGYHDKQLLEWSDSICTGLQLTNHWQDVAIDVSRNRIYLPEDARIRHGVTEDALREGRLSGCFRSLMIEEVGLARTHFEAGRPLCNAVRGRLRWELRLTWLGGQRILEKIEGADYDVFNRRPRLGTGDALRIARRAIVWTA